VQKTSSRQRTSNVKNEEQKGHGDIVEANGGPIEESNEVTREMKLDFVGKIKKLTNQGLTSLVHKIKEVKAQSITDLPDEKI
jgi:hypothetical protein